MWAQNNFSTGFHEPISEGGLFVATHEFLPVGNHVDIELDLPGGHTLHVRGKVMWGLNPRDPSETTPGMGIRFEALPPPDREAICEFMRSREPMFWDE